MKRHLIRSLLWGATSIVALSSGLSHGADAETATESLSSEPSCGPLREKMKEHEGQAWQSLHQEVIEGRIEDVQIIDQCMGARRVLQLKILSGTEPYLVTLGPTEFVDDKVFRFALGDDIKVQGVVYDTKGEKTVIAASIEKGSQKLVLRDQHGRPTWLVGKKPRHHKHKAAH